MTHRKDPTSEVLDRWRVLAEQRLTHLTELFESGRWRRYHSERTFFENIREARNAVETWRDLAAGRPPSNRSARSNPPQRANLRTIEPAPPVMPAVAEAPIVPAVVDMEALERALEIPEPVPDYATIEQRYPLLRNPMWPPPLRPG